MDICVKFEMRQQMYAKKTKTKAYIILDYLLESLCQMYYTVYSR